MSGKRAEGAVKIRSLPTRRTVTALALLGALVLGFALQDAGLARAHFLLNLNIRMIHVEHLDDGLRVYLRLPMSYLVADRLGPIGPDGLPEPAPYTTNRMEDDRLVHYLDTGALRADPLGLGRLVSDGHRFTAGDAPLTAEVVFRSTHL